VIRSPLSRLTKRATGRQQALAKGYPWATPGWCRGLPPVREGSRGSNLW